MSFALVQGLHGSILESRMSSTLSCSEHSDQTFSVAFNSRCSRWNVLRFVALGSVRFRHPYLSKSRPTLRYEYACETRMKLVFRTRCHVRAWVDYCSTSRKTYSWYTNRRSCHNTDVRGQIGWPTLAWRPPERHIVLVLTDRTFAYSGATSYFLEQLWLASELDTQWFCFRLALCLLLLRFTLTRLVMLVVIRKSCQLSSIWNVRSPSRQRLMPSPPLIVSAASKSIMCQDATDLHFVAWQVFCVPDFCNWPKCIVSTLL